MVVRRKWEIDFISPFSSARMRTRRGRTSLSCIRLSAGLGSRPVAACEKEASYFWRLNGQRLSWRRRYSTTFQLASGLYWAIEAPRAAVFGPRSFW